MLMVFIVILALKEFFKCSKRSSLIFDQKKFRESPYKKVRKKDLLFRQKVPVYFFG